MPFWTTSLKRRFIWLNPLVESSIKSLVCKLHKSLYGLKRALQTWFDRLKSTLVQFGFMASKCDPSLFVYSKNSTLLYMVYVDDIIVIGSDPSLVNQIVPNWMQSFPLKNLVLLATFLALKLKPKLMVIFSCPKACTHMPKLICMRLSLALLLWLLAANSLKMAQNLSLVQLCTLQVCGWGSPICHHHQD